MSDSKYSFVVAIMTVGGLIGSLAAAYFSDRYGRRGSLFGINVLMGIGSLVMALAVAPEGMMVGRFIVGLGIGSVTVIVPAYISECVPTSSRGFFGALVQLITCIGIMATQVIGLYWSTLSRWRYIFGMGILLAVAQIGLLLFCVDSPRYLASLSDGFESAKASLLRLRNCSEIEAEEEINEWRRDWANHAVSSASSDADNNNTESQQQHHVNTFTFITNPAFRKALFLVFLVQFTQQFSGINAVIFYSTSIMSTIFPNSSGMITVYISVVNIVFTGLSAYLMDKAGRRTLFLLSTASMTVTAFLLGWSIEHKQDVISVIAILGYVATFALGLGPIPFLMVPELVDTPAVSSACSISLATNMISNFLVSAGFLSLRNLMGQGQVFYLFGLFLILLFAVSYLVLPETKNREVEEIIRSNYTIYPVHYHTLPNDEEEE
ncbi:general substrate transporter [Backusella circina FSU 941]|nr:general substrate transporter [Backusella circina FSU 941]